MNELKYIYTNNNIKLIIEEDPIGFYLIVYENPSSLHSSEDYLIDTLENAFQEAEEKFGILKSQWEKVD